MLFSCQASYRVAASEPLFRRFLVGDTGAGLTEALPGRGVGARWVRASNREISRALHITERTARNHLSKILRKLGLKDR